MGARKKIRPSQVAPIEISASPSQNATVEEVKTWLRDFVTADQYTYDAEAMDRWSLDGKDLHGLGKKGRATISFLVISLKQVLGLGGEKPMAARKIAGKIWGLREVAQGVGTVAHGRVEDGTDGGDEVEDRIEVEQDGECL